MKSAKLLIVDSMKRLNPTSVLDLGCGSCKFSQKFIDKGIAVTGVDKNTSNKLNNNFTFIQQDILNFKFQLKYDLIIGTGILHFLERKSAYKLIKKMQDNTLSKGFHFLICMSNEERSDEKVYFYPNKEELNKLYFGWEIIHNALSLSKKHGETMNQHKVIIFLAKKI